MNERRSFSPRVVFAGLVVSLVLALGVAFGIYFRYVRFEPVAIRHVPTHFDVRVRVAVEQAVVYEPFRRHLLALLEAGKKGPESRLLHLERKTTLELGVDSREFVVGFDGQKDWVLGLGGLFRRDGVASGIGRLLTDEGRGFRLLGGPERVLLPRGEALGVGEDGTLLAASADPLFVTSAQGGGDDLAPGLVSFRVAPADGFVLDDGRRVRRLDGVIRAGERFVYEVTCEAVTSWGQLDRLPTPTTQPFLRFFQLAKLDLGRLEQEGDVRVRVRGELDRAQFESLLGELAAQIRARVGLPD